MACNHVSTHTSANWCSNSAGPTIRSAFIVLVEEVFADNDGVGVRHFGPLARAVFARIWIARAS